MAGNISPIFSKQGSIQSGAALPIAVTAADYTGVGAHNVGVWDADEINGGFIQKLRFKSLGVNAATVARIYINDGNLNYTSGLVTAAVSAAANGTPSTSGGTLATGNYFARIQPVDQYGAVPLAGSIATFNAESAAVAVTGPAGSILWAWPAVTGAAKYRIFVGNVANNAYGFFETTATPGTAIANSYTQTTALQTVGTDLKVGSIQDYFHNQMFYGELSLPATAASNTAAQPDIDYTINLALPPGHRILVGLAGNVASGWVCTGIGGAY